MIYHAPDNLFKGYTLCKLRVKITSQNYLDHHIDDDNMLACDKHDYVDRSKVNCPTCLYKITPGISLYKNSTGNKKFIKDEKIVPAVVAALRFVDAHRRSTGELFSNSSHDAIVYLLEQENIHIPQTKCAACYDGKVRHYHGTYCYKESWGEDELVCTDSYQSCSICSGTGSISEETIFWQVKI